MRKRTLFREKKKEVSLSTALKSVVKGRKHAGLDFVTKKHPENKAHLFSTSRTGYYRGV